MATISIRKEKIEMQKGMVILSLKEYERLFARAMPTYYLTGRAAAQVDKLVARGLKAHRAGKTKVLRSLADLD